MVKQSPASTTQVVELVDALHAGGKPLAVVANQPDRTRSEEVDATGAFLCAGEPRPMSDAEKYEFDRLGYLVLRDFLSADEVDSLRAATAKLEAHANTMIAPESGAEPQPPHKLSPWGRTLYHFDPELGYHVRIAQKQGSSFAPKACILPLLQAIAQESDTCMFAYLLLQANHAGGNGLEVDGNGRSTIIEDYFNADTAFDVLVDHPKTMAYITEIIQDRPTINNSEIRLRYPGNRSDSHQPGGQQLGPPTGKYQYQMNNGTIDCKMVRIIYFIHDVKNEDGAFCVTPGSHKSNVAPPPGFATAHPDHDPTMVGLEVKAGDAVLFTEALRHGGFTITSGAPRKTLHVGYGPYWLMSQNISTMDEPPFLLEGTYQRYTDAQRALFNAWPREDRAGPSFAQSTTRGKL